jgi:hypothetical protein
LVLALQVLSSLVVGWLPGAAIYRAPVLDRERRAALDAEERTFWAVILSVAVSLCAALALAAVGRYSLTRVLAVDLAVTAAAVAVARGRLRMPAARRATASAVLPLAIVALACWRFFPPAEYVIGGKDPGVYISEGIQIAQRGTLLIRDETVASVPAAARDLFFPRYTDHEGVPRPDYFSLRFMGFFVLDPAAGTIVGQFPHVFPASVAIGYGIHGLTGALWTTGVWAILGSLAVYFAGARLFGKPVAAIAVALLASNVAQTWFGRYPNAEIVMQALLFAGLLAYARATVDEIPFFAAVAGGLFGLLLFLRLDTVLGIAAVAAAGALEMARGRRLHFSFWLVLAGPALAACVYLTQLMQPYLYLYQVYVTHIPAWQYAALAAVAIAAGVVIRQARRSPSLSHRVTTLVPLALAIAIVIAGLYALFLRQPGGKLAEHDAYALRTFANLYFTVPGVLAALLGFWLTSRDRFWRDPALFLTIALFWASVFYKIRIVPEHFWMSRRFVPVVIPGALLLLCAAALSTGTAGARAKAIRWIVGGTFVLLLASSFLRVSGPVLANIEYEGLIPRVEALAGRFGANDLLVVESRNSGGDVHVLATPLAYIYAKRVLVLASPTPDRQAMSQFVAWARARYDRVFFIGGGGTDLLSRDYGVRPVASERFETPEFQLSTERLPIPSTRKFIFGIYEFVDPPAERDMWFDLDVGARDDLYVLRFNASEVADGTTFRWTLGTSYVTVPSVPANAREVTLVLNDGGRPPAAPQARVTVFLDDTRLGEITLASGPFRPYTLALPDEVAAKAAAATGPVRLRLVSTLWNPHDVLGSPDTRNLGVMVDRVTIK